MAELRRILAGGTVEAPAGQLAAALSEGAAPAGSASPGALPDAERTVVDPIALASLVIP